MAKPYMLSGSVGFVGYEPGQSRTETVKLFLDILEIALDDPSFVRLAQAVIRLGGIEGVRELIESRRSKR